MPGERGWHRRWEEQRQRSEPRGLVPGSPDGRCVEAPCLVGANGVRPTVVGHYPKQLAALDRTNINAQGLIVEATLTGSTEAVHHAATLDPLTAAVCTLPEIRAMVDGMLEAQARRLPQFRKETAWRAPQTAVVR